jgi:putative transposase
MGRKQYTEEQIAFALRHAESGTPVAEIILRLGVSESPFDHRRTQWGGMNCEEAGRLKHVEDENRRLEQLVADQA